MTAHGRIWFAVLESARDYAAGFSRSMRMAPFAAAPFITALLVSLPACKRSYRRAARIPRVLPPPHIMPL
jgi:hypothetical protein